MGKVAFLFLVVFYVLMAIPCIGVAWLGKNLIEQLGRYPSKTSAIQMSVFFKLIVLEVVSVSLILMFFKSLVSD